MRKIRTIKKKLMQKKITAKIKDFTTKNSKLSQRKAKNNFGR